MSAYLVTSEEYYGGGHAAVFVERKAAIAYTQTTLQGLDYQLRKVPMSGVKVEDNAYMVLTEEWYGSDNPLFAPMVEGSDEWRGGDCPMAFATREEAETHMMIVQDKLGSATDVCVHTVKIM